MGYDLHITRKECWADDEDAGFISLQEWQTYIANDPDIIPDQENPHDENHVYIRADGNWPLWFNPRLGNIYTKNPPTDVIEKMVKIAAVLKARVQGDDQEFYDLEGNPVYEQVTGEAANNEKINNNYAWYFFAIVFVISIIWHIVFPSKLISHTRPNRAQFLTMRVC